MGIKYNEALRKQISMSILNDLDKLEDEWNNIYEANKANIKLFTCDMQNGGSKDFENRKKMLYIMHRFRDNALELCDLKDYSIDTTTKAYKWVINTTTINLGNYVTNWKAFGGGSSFKSLDGIKYSTLIEDSDYAWKIFYKYGDKIPIGFNSAPSSGAGRYYPNKYLTKDSKDYVRSNEFLKNGNYKIIQDSEHSINTDYIIDGESFYDDGRIFVASKVDVWNQVTHVETRTYKTYNPFWPFGKKTITESSVDVPLEDNTHTTKPEPLVEDIEFDKLLKYGNKDTAYEWGKKCISLLNLNETRSSEEYDEFIAKDFTVKNIVEGEVKRFLVKDTEYTQEYADNFIDIYKPIKQTHTYTWKQKLYSYDTYIYYDMFYTSSDHRSYAVGTIKSVNKKWIRKNIKAKYKSAYESLKAKGDVESNTILRCVYDNYDLYWDMGWAVEVVVEFTGVHKENNSSLMPTPYITEDAFISLSKEYIEKVKQKIYSAKSNYETSKNWFQTTDKEPEKHYKEFANYFDRKLESKQDCIIVLRNIVENIVPWIPGRAEALKITLDYTEDLDVFPNIIKTRLNKDNGSLIQNYSMLISQDNELKKFYQNEEIVKLSLKKMLVCRAADLEDSNAFNKTNYPHYIDIEDINKYYEGKKFSVGDTIYIANDIYPEQENKITSIKTWTTKKTDYTNFNGETGLGAVVVDATVTRLGLEKALSNYLFVTDEQENLITSANLRVIKLLQN